MKALENKILLDAKVIDNKILKVDFFFNYQIDTKILKDVGEYLASKFKNVDKVLTIEASGIAFGIAVAYALGNVPVIFAKKSKTALTINDDNYICLIHSFTHGDDCHVYVRKDFLKPGDNVLIVDDFLATGNAAIGLLDILKEAKCNVVGLAAGIEKEMQGGRKRLEDLGVKVVSAARIKEFKNNKPVFSKEEC